ncbi:MAG: hypothetical protein RL756_1650, partial [Pseudomonadota bacterium]
SSPSPPPRTALGFPSPSDLLGKPNTFPKIGTLS